MRIEYIDIVNFRGISKARVFLNGHSVLIGDNNAGKSTIFEAIDLVLGPDRLNRIPVVDEHDFHNGNYYDESGNCPKIEIEVLIIDLEDSQLTKFKNNLEFYDTESLSILPEGKIKNVDDENVIPGLRVKFIGSYNPEDDDFEGETFFCSPQREDETLTRFSKGDKRECGFLYLRALRTGARALSMERGSLLDIILRIKDVRPKMWEAVLDQLRKTPVATDSEAGISDILEGIQKALKEFVPSDWGSQPHLRVSDLTREHLRKTLTIFMSTGKGEYSAPFQHQGTGTINTMVLALLSMIAETKQNVIFAMEEPEIAIPPYTQKRIIDSIRKKSTQAIFTSHSPFVLEEFPPSQIILIQRDDEGVVKSQAVELPSTIKPKTYNAEFRLRFAEALLAKRILLTEGTTEAIAYSAAGRRLNELKPTIYSSLEENGVAIFDARSETEIPNYGKYFENLGKVVFAVFDKQKPDALKKINENVKYPYESQHKGFEDLLIEEMDQDILKQYYELLITENNWPSHLSKASNRNNIDEVKTVLKKYLEGKKTDKDSSELIGMCKKTKQVPETIRNVLKSIKAELEKPNTENTVE